MIVLILCYKDANLDNHPDNINFPNMAWKVSPHTKQEQSVDTAVYALLKKTLILN